MPQSSYIYRSHNELNPTLTVERAGTYRIHAAIHWSRENHTRQCTEIQELISGTVVRLDTNDGQVYVDNDKLMHVGGAGVANYRTLQMEEIPRSNVVVTALPEGGAAIIAGAELEAFRAFQAVRDAKPPRPKREGRQIDLR
jgi:hypothetical protein